MGGKRETSDSHSMASASSHRSDSGRKTTRFSTLRRVIQDMQQQRMSSSRRRKPTSSSSAETDPRASSAALSSGDVVGWPSTSCRAVDDSRVGSTSPALDEEELSGTSHDTTIAEDLDCPLCTLSQPSAELLRVTSGCPHRMCRTCLHRYLNIEIMESRVNLECPACPERLHPNDIRRILGASANALELLGKYEEFTLRRLLVHEPDARWCPAPDCGYVVIASGCASCPKLTCERPGCNTLFCYHCKQTWHPNQTCDAARAERASNQRASLACSQDSGSQSDIKPCPRCGAFIVKMDDGSCNHMTCAMCGAEFCWLCMKEISDLHYLSPSGCTFWGKKPWSRKKKILWQLGTLIGAPVGITLIAAIAVPAIIIGVPVWVGKKLYARCAAMSKHKRNGVVAGGVIAATLVSPVIAALAVGIGVPILLAYVYGVVPISLCRSGGCGVSTTDTGGVRIDFDESDVRTENNPSQFNASDTRSVVETDGHRAINPSIGPSIGEMSVGLTNSLSASGSHLDRVGVIREDCDRDSASQQAIAGSCINASLSGSMHLAGPSGYQHRLEVQAEVTVTHAQHQKRSSLSSESANFSIDAKSVTVSFGDNTSVVALAGSICNRDKDNVSAVLSIADVPLASDSAPTNNQPPSCTTASVSSPSYVVSMPPIDDHSSVPRASFHRYGSPPSSLRSVSFVHGDVMHADGSVTSSNVGALSRPSYKRQGISVTDSIDECAESVSVFDDTVVDVCRNEPVGVVVKPGADHKAAVQLPHSVLPEVSGCSFRDSDRSRPISDADFCRAVTVGIATSCADDGDVDGLSATSSFNTASLSDYCSIGVEDRVLCLDSSTASSSVPLDRSMPTSHV